MENENFWNGKWEVIHLSTTQYVCLILYFPSTFTSIQASWGLSCNEVSQRFVVPLLLIISTFNQYFTDPAISKAHKSNVRIRWTKWMMWLQILLYYLPPTSQKHGKQPADGFRTGLRFRRSGYCLTSSGTIKPVAEPFNVPHIYNTWYCPFLKVSLLVSRNYLDIISVYKSLVATVAVHFWMNLNTILTLVSNNCVSL